MKFKVKKEEINQLILNTHTYVVGDREMLIRDLPDEVEFEGEPVGNVKTYKEGYRDGLNNADDENYIATRDLPPIESSEEYIVKLLTDRFEITPKSENTDTYLQSPNVYDLAELILANFTRKLESKSPPNFVDFETDSTEDLKQISVVLNKLFRTPDRNHFEVLPDIEKGRIIGHGQVMMRFNTLVKEIII